MTARPPVPEPSVHDGDDDTGTAGPGSGTPATSGDGTGTGSGTGSDRVRPRWWARRRTLVVVSGVTAGAVLLAGVGDLVIAHVARERLVNAAVCRLRPVGRVSADLTGTLAGLRLLTGDVGTVRISARDVTRGGLGMSVHAELYGVTTKGTSAGGSATATVSYERLAGQLGRGVAGLRPGPDGSGGLVLTGTLAGLPLPLTVHARISTTARSVTVTPTDVDVLGQVFRVESLSASPRTAPLAAKLAPHTVTVPGLPSGVRITGARAGSDGLRLTASISPGTASQHTNGCAAHRT